MHRQRTIEAAAATMASKSSAATDGTQMRQRQTRNLTCGTRSLLAGHTVALPALVQRQPPAAAWRPCGCAPAWRSCACCRWRGWRPAAVAAMLCWANSKQGPRRAPALLCDELGQTTNLQLGPQALGVDLLAALPALKQAVDSAACPNFAGASNNQVQVFA